MEASDLVEKQKATHRRADFAFAGTVVAVILLAALFYLAFPAVAALLFISGLIAYALLPIVDRVARKVPRWAAVGVVGLGVLAFTGGVVAIVVPLVKDQVQSAGDVTQKVKDLGREGWGRVKAALPDRLEPKAEQVAAGTVESAKQQAPSGEDLKQYAKKSSHIVAGVTSAIIFIPAFVVLMLFAYHRFFRMLMEAVPTRWRRRFDERGRELDEALSGFVRGQLLNALILAVLYSIAFTIIGIPLGIVIGIFAGVGELIPYVGNAVGLGLGCLMAFAGGSPMDAVWVLATFAVLQTFEATVSGPLIVGKKAKLRPMALLLALAIGGELFGIIGLVLAVPVTAALKVATKVAVHAWQRMPAFENG